MNAAPSKRIVLTGVSRGLGRALAEGLIARGHTVLGCARAAEAIDELRRQHGPPHAFEVVDVGRDDEVRRWAEGVLADGGTPDLVVNNAGLINRGAPLWEIADEEFSLLLDVNVRGIANVVRHFVPAMIRRGHGVIVNVSSGWGRSVAREVAPYCATKWALEGLTRALAAELPPGMAAVPLNPGTVNTAMLQSCLGDAAGSRPGPDSWAQRAIPLLLRLGPKDNGHPMSVPP